MDQDRFGAHWRGHLEEALSGIEDWRRAHPTATFAELEAAVEERLNWLRARLLEAVALRSGAADLEASSARERPRCPQCGGVLQLRGQQERQLSVQGDPQVHLRRSDATCSVCGSGLFTHGWGTGLAAGRVVPPAGAEPGAIGPLAALGASARGPGLFHRCEGES